MGADDHDIGIREWYLVLIDIVHQDVLVLLLYTIAEEVVCCVFP